MPDLNQCTRLAASGMLAAAAALAGSHSSAQPGALEEIVVTSSRLPLPRKTLATSIATLDADAIVARGYPTLVALLRQLPGVHVASNGGMGQVTGMRIRGEDVFRTLTLIDGIRLSDPGGTQIGPQLEHLGSNGIGRVELLRGPQGLAWGADAGGVLNLQSLRSPKAFDARLELESGSRDTQRYHASVAGKGERLDYSAMLSQLGTDGFNSLLADTQLQDRDGYDNRTLHLRTHLALGEAWELQLVHRDTSATSAYDECYSQQPTHDCRSTFGQEASRIGLQQAQGRFAQQLSVAQTTTRRAYLADAQPSFATEGELQRVEYQGSFAAMPGLTLAFGADLETARQEARERDNRGVHVEVLADLGEQLFLNAGLRHDDNEDFGSNLSERIGLAWLQPLNGLQLKLHGSTGSGFRAPSSYEIAYNLGPWALPPAAGVALQQERSRGWEIGADLFAADWQVGLTWFDQRITDAIDFDLSGFSGYLQTSGTSRSRGLELTGTRALTRSVQLEANYTWNDAQRPDGQPRRYRPGHVGNLGLSWSPAPLMQLSAWWRASSAPWDESVAAAPAGHAVLDLQGNYDVQQGVQLHLRIENAADRDYQEIAGYRTAGRSVHLGLRLALNAL